MKNYENRGWTTFILGALADGNAQAILDAGWFLRADGENGMSLDIPRDLAAARSCGFGRISRRGWWTLDHPVLGVVQMKSGLAFPSGKPYLFIRVNGRMVAQRWPGGRRWAAPFRWGYGRELGLDEVEEVERLLAPHFPA